MTQSPSEPSIGSRQRFWRRVTWIAAAGTLLPAPLGALATLTGMARHQQAAWEDPSAQESVAPAQLAEAISGTLGYTAVGAAFSCIGLVVLLFSIAKLRGLSREARLRAAA